MRFPAYCYACKSVFRNPLHNTAAPSRCELCKTAFSADNKSALPDFCIRDVPRLLNAFIFVHGSIHFKDEKRRMKDYHQFAELLSHGNKCFVILNETIEAATVSVLDAWVNHCEAAMLDDSLYRRMYEDEKELGYLQRAVLEHFTT